jgi:hypothetical protein
MSASNLMELERANVLNEIYLAQKAKIKKNLSEPWR